MTKLADTKCKVLLQKIPLDLLIEKFNYAKLTPLNKHGGKRREPIDFIYHPEPRVRIKVSISVWVDNLVELDLTHEYITHQTESPRYIYERIHDYNSIIDTLESYDNFTFKCIPKKTINKKLTPKTLLLLQEELSYENYHMINNHS
jgi:hypothetical protein